MTTPACRCRSRVAQAAAEGRLRGGAVVRPRDGPRHRRPGPRGVGVRALQRARRPARQPRRGRAARPARHLPQLGLRAAAAAVRRGRIRLPGVRARRSSTSPTARSSGCSSTTSRSTSGTAACSSTSACLDLRAGVLTREVHWRSPGGPRGADPQHPAGLVHAPLDRRDRVRGRAARRRRPDRPAVRARRERGAARRGQGPADAAVLDQPAGADRAGRRRPPAGAPAPHPAQRHRRRRRRRPRGRGHGRAGLVLRQRDPPRLGTGHGDGHAAARAEAASW